MQFSIIIPTHNREALLREAIESIWGQTFTDLEVIVVDDGSTDGTSRYLESISDRVTVVTQENSGPGAARNHGANHATGVYLAFLDSDDLWFPWTLQTYADIAEEAGYPSIISGSMLPFSSREELASANRDAPLYRSYRSYGHAAGNGEYSGSGLIAIRSDVFHRTNGFNQNIRNAEDHDFLLSVCTENNYIAIRKPSTVARRQTPGQLTECTEHLFNGISHLIENEKSGNYPGDGEIAQHRRKIIAQHVRPACQKLANAGRFDEANRLFIDTFAWHVSLRRWKFLFGFPFLSFTKLLRRPIERKAPSPDGHS